MIPKIKCQGKDLSTVDGCPNDARYINTQKEFLCSLCDMRRAFTSVRISDVPTLILSLSDPALVDVAKMVTWRRNRLPEGTE